MGNSIPRPVDDVFSLAENAADGCHKHEAGIGIMQTTESVLREALANALEGNQEFGTARAAKKAGSAAQKQADRNATAFVFTARDVLKPRLGQHWSEAWVEAGFANRSLEIPVVISKRLALVKLLELYFTAHPTHEVAPLNVTAVQAALLHTAFSNAISAANNARTTQAVCAKNRNDVVEVLRDRLRALVSELMLLIGPDDPRWVDFGFNIPSAEPTPDAPEGLVLRGGASGHLVADWENTPRAMRYHVYIQLVDEEGDFVLAKTVTDSDADLNTLAPGTRVRVRVTAVNDNGESLPSESVEYVVP